MDFVVTSVQTGATGRITKWRKSAKFFYFGPLRSRALGFESRWGRRPSSVLEGVDPKTHALEQTLAVASQNAAFIASLRAPTHPFDAPK